MKTQDQSSTSHEMNPLLNLAIGESQRRKQTIRELATHIDISYPYLMALARGERPAETMNRKVVVSFSDYLSIPVAQAYLLAGALKPKDFLVESTAESKLARLFTQMRTDKVWCGFMPSDAGLASLDSDVQILIGLLYEQVTHMSGLSSVCIDEPEE